MSAGEVWGKKLHADACVEAFDSQLRASPFLGYDFPLKLQIWGIPDTFCALCVLWSTSGIKRYGREIMVTVRESLWKLALQWRRVDWQVWARLSFGDQQSNGQWTSRPH